MRKIRCYDELSIYAKRMLNLMGDPAWFGLGYDIWENENGWIIYNEENDKFTKYNNIDELDYTLSKMLIDFVAEQIKLSDDPEEISDTAKYLIL